MIVEGLNAPRLFCLRKCSPVWNRALESFSNDRFAGIEHSYLFRMNVLPESSTRIFFECAFSRNRALESFSNDRLAGIEHSNLFRMIVLAELSTRIFLECSFRPI